jgi:hypothetical protein
MPMEQPGCSPHGLPRRTRWTTAEDRSSPRMWVVHEPTRADWVARLAQTSARIQRMFERARSHTDRVPPQLASLEAAIEAARREFASFRQEDEEALVPPEMATFERTAAFLMRSAAWLLERDGVVLEAPVLTPGPEGSIDILWRSQETELLVNIPPGRSEADFYGDTKDGLRIKGTFNPDIHHSGILSWLRDRR